MRCRGQLSFTHFSFISGSRDFITQLLQQISQLLVFLLIFIVKNVFTQSVASCQLVPPTICSIVKMLPAAIHCRSTRHAKSPPMRVVRGQDNLCTCGMYLLQLRAQKKEITKMSTNLLHCLILSVSKYSAQRHKICARSFIAAQQQEYSHSCALN